MPITPNVKERCGKSNPPLVILEEEEDIDPIVNKTSAWQKVT